jgi:putative salt-induced outer membrane protein
VSTQIKNSLGLTVALMDKLSARISYDVIYDTDPPIGFKSTDTATKLSLVYKIG